MHAGGKFDDKAYKVSGGLHGVGVSVVNALATSDLEIIGDTRAVGTKITFKADPEIFDVTVYDKKTLENRFREMAFLNKGVRRTPKIKEMSQKLNLNMTVESKNL